MNRLTARATTVVALVFLGIALLGGERTGYAQPRSDNDAVKVACCMARARSSSSIVQAFTGSPGYYALC